MAEIDDSRELLELGLAPGEDSHKLSEWLANRGRRLLGKGSTRLVMEHTNPMYVSKCAYTETADQTLALGAQVSVG